MQTYFDVLGTMLDCSRGAVYRVETLEKFIDVLAAAGYQMLQLYTEDTYEIEGEPYFGHFRGRYSQEELRRLDRYAAARGIELVPCIQTLAHLGGIARWGAYADHFDVGDILLVDDERTYRLIERMIGVCRACFTSRRIHIGMDEAHMVGLGKYLDKHGYGDRFELLHRHLERVAAIARRYDFTPMMWSDMFFRLASGGAYDAGDPETEASVAALIPSGVELVMWNYTGKTEADYDRMFLAHRKLGAEPWFAGGAWSWCGHIPHNTQSIRRTAAAVRSCMANGVRRMMITTWKDDGAECSLWGILPTLVLAAEFSRGNFDEAACRRAFRRIVGVSLEDFMTLDLPDQYTETDEIVTPSKYTLYNDPFVGVFDCHIHAGVEAYYRRCAARLWARAEDARFGYVFATEAALCDLLAVKACLGIRTRAFYRERDLPALRRLAEETYAAAIGKAEVFYARFAAQWRIENKENGFEVQDVRLGGVSRRLRHCREMLLDFCDGRIERIEPLEEEALPLRAGLDTEKDYFYNNWLKIAMIDPWRY